MNRFVEKLILKNRVLSLNDFIKHCRDTAEKGTISYKIVKQEILNHFGKDVFKLGEVTDLITNTKWYEENKYDICEVAERVKQQLNKLVQEKLLCEVNRNLYRINIVHKSME